MDAERARRIRLWLYSLPFWTAEWRYAEPDSAVPFFRRPLCVALCHEARPRALESIRGTHP